MQNLESKSPTELEGDIKSQLTPRGIAIGVLGCVVITAASVYTALKMGALPWPIIFSALISLGFLQALETWKRKKNAHLGYANTEGGSGANAETSENEARAGAKKSILNEANVTHTIMSAGAMIAGGLAFTIPGIWITAQQEAAAAGAGNGAMGAAANGAAAASAASAAASAASPASVASAATAAPGFLEILGISLAGSLIGLVACALLRKRFVHDKTLEYPIGTAAAQTLKIGDDASNMGPKLFAAMGLSGLWCFLRDGLRLVPGLIGSHLGPPGIAFGVYLSPLMIAVGFIVGIAPMVAWCVGALWQWVWMTQIGPAMPWMDSATCASANSNLGMGMMMGCGLAIVATEALRLKESAAVGRFFDSWKSAATNGRKLAVGPSAKDTRAARATLADPTTANPTTVGATAANRTAVGPTAVGPTAVGPTAAGPAAASRTAADPTTANPSAAIPTAAALLAAAAACALTLLLGLSPLAAVVVTLLAFVAVAMSAQSVGQTGIDPMEIFGLIVLLAVAALGETSQVKLFFVAAIVAVACGLGGDLMNDLKAGAILKTNPRAQLAGQAIGAVVGCLVATVAIFAIGSAYGPESFGPGREFVAAQASVVANLVGGIQHRWFFAIGLGIGAGLYLAKLPSMMIGLGVYLPFYLTLTAFLGCLFRVYADTVEARRRLKMQPAEADAAKERYEQTALVVASGILGGESVVGVLLAIFAVTSAFL